MEYLIILIINILCTSVLSSLEKKSSDYKKKKIIMGQWPYNIVMLISLIPLIASDKDILNQNTAFYISVIFIIFFYIFQALKLLTTQKEH